MVERSTNGIFQFICKKSGYEQFRLEDDDSMENISVQYIFFRRFFQIYFTERCSKKSVFPRLIDEIDLITDGSHRIKIRRQIQIGMFLDELRYGKGEICDFLIIVRF